MAAKRARDISIKLKDKKEVSNFLYLYSMLLAIKSLCNSMELQDKFIYQLNDTEILHQIVLIGKNCQ